jgi:hypothetical protein
MRCLNCNTVVADSDACCMSCGARCTTPVREQSGGKPIPYIALVMLLVGMTFGYAQTYQPGQSLKAALQDRTALRDRATTANIWGLGFCLVGFCGDVLRWSLRRRANAVEKEPVQACSGGATQEQTKPARGYGGIIRVVCAVVWAAVFFIGAVLIAAMIVVVIAGNDPEQKEWADQTGQMLVPWFFFGSIIVAGLLAKLGMLPGTRRRTG